MPFVLRIILVGIVAAVMQPAHAVPSAERANGLPRAALVIGNGAYTNIVPLKNPPNDARDMCSKLREIGYVVSCFTDVGTRAQLRAVLQDFAQSLSSDRVGLVYYAGHAMQIEGENYLVPTGARFDSAA